MADGGEGQEQGSGSKIYIRKKVSLNYYIISFKMQFISKQGLTAREHAHDQVELRT